MSTVHSPSVAFLSFHFPCSHWHFHPSACFFFVCCHPSSSSPNFKPTFLTLGHRRCKSYQHQRQFHRSSLPAFCPYILPRSRARLHRWFRTLSRDWSSGYVTETKSAALNRSLFCYRGSLSLAPKQACPPTERPNDAMTASSLVLSEASSSFPTWFTRVTHASNVPALAHPQVGVSTVSLSSVAFLSFHFPVYHWHFHFSACFLFVHCRLSSSFPDFNPHSSHITLGHLWRTAT